jgi:hypothetical protein
MNSPELMVALLALTQAESLPNSFTFAQEEFSGWRTEATTEIRRQRFNEGRDVPPVVADVRCRAERNGISVTVDRRGTHGIEFGGRLDIDGDGEEDDAFQDDQVHSLRIGRRSYQAKIVYTAFFPWRFRDVIYPGDSGVDTIIPLVPSRLAVRSSATAPWLDVLTLLDDLLEARSVRIGYGEIVDGQVPSMSYFDVPLRGLGPALAWCDRQIHSDRAYRLPAD